jgi:hypothetical protein
MRRRAIALGVLALGFILLQTNFAAAQSSKALESPIGKVMALEGSARIERKAVVAALASVGGPLEAKIGEVVYQGDIIRTAAASKLGLVFADGTALNVFSNAEIELNEFVYLPEGKRNSSAFNLVKGTFTFIGGKMVKNGEMRVNTTAATMGIRGTTAHIVVGEDGSVRFSTLVEEKK